MKIKKFKARCSQLNHIKIIELTDNQIIELKTLSEKLKLTDKQQEKLNYLIQKKDNPELTLGTKNYCKKWLKEQVYNRKKEFSSKYTEKGNIVEDNSIDFIAKMLNYGMLFKNYQFYENEYFEGTPDIVIDIIIDAKNSWDQDTFPLLDEEISEQDYYGQLQGYMDLTGKLKAKLIYVLSDTPINIIEKEAYFWCKNNGYEDLDIDILKQFIKKMTYADIEDKYKIKTFDIEYDSEYIKNAKKGVMLCRKYINELIKKLPE